MPNWCENELTIRGSSGVLACLEAIRGEPDEDGPCHLDFRKIVPMPEILKGTTAGGTVDRGYVLLGDDELGQKMLSYPWVKTEGITDLAALRDHIRRSWPEVEEEARRSMQAEQETGYRNWYDWCVVHWGTKWPACFFRPSDNATDTEAVIAFCTAWSPPRPVVVELSRQFPDLDFTLEYWEGGCCFQGILRAQGGVALQDEAYDYSGSRGG